MNYLNSALSHYFFQVTSQSLAASDPSRNSGYILPLQGSCQEKKIPKVLRKLLQHCDEDNEVLWEHMQGTESTDSTQQITPITLHLSKHRQEPVVSNTISLSLITVIYLYSQVLENYIPSLPCTYQILVPSLGERWAQLQSLWVFSHYWFLWILQSLATQLHFSG